MSFLSKMTDIVSASADAVSSTATEIASFVGRTINKSIDATVKLVDAAIENTIFVMKQVAKASVRVFVAAKRAFTKAVVFAVNVACQTLGVATSLAIGGVAGVLANPLITHPAKFVSGWRPNDEVQSSIERLTMDARTCSCNEKGTGGVRPESCSSEIPKAHYINGINTTQEAHCETLRKLATSTCREFTGTLNPSEGMFKDIVECVNNIQRNDTPPGRALYEKLSKEIDGPGPFPIELFAHSQGGLITQSALHDLRNELMHNLSDEMFPERDLSDDERAQLESAVNKKMSRIKVNSFGTAERGWPPGPFYKGFTNLSDPVPNVIAAAQMNNLWHLTDTQSVPVNRFNRPHINPISSHSMDDVYIEEYVREFTKETPSFCACRKPLAS